MYLRLLATIFPVKYESACQILLVNFENPIHLQPLPHNFCAGVSLGRLVCECTCEFFSDFSSWKPVRSYLVSYGMLIPSSRHKVVHLEDWYRGSPSHGSEFLGCKVLFPALSLPDLTRHSLAERTSQCVAHFQCCRCVTHFLAVVRICDKTRVVS
jgi:hypothetical protein